MSGTPGSDDRRGSGVEGRAHQPQAQWVNLNGGIYIEKVFWLIAFIPFVLATGGMVAYFQGQLYGLLVSGVGVFGAVALLLFSVRAFPIGDPNVTEEGRKRGIGSVQRFGTWFIMTVSVVVASPILILFLLI